MYFESSTHWNVIPSGLPPQRKSTIGYTVNTTKQQLLPVRNVSVPADIRNLTLESGDSSIWSIDTSASTSSSSSISPTAISTKAYYRQLYDAGPTEDDSHRVYVGPCTCPYYCRHHPEIEVERCRLRCQCTNWCWYHQGVVDMISRYGIRLVHQRWRKALYERRHENLSEEEQLALRKIVPQPTMRELATMMTEEGWRFDSSEVFRWQ